jgi:hypothetical protein
MDGRWFDDVTRKLALGVSRRTVFKGMAGAVGGAFVRLWRGGPVAAQGGTCNSSQDCPASYGFNECCFGFCCADGQGCLGATCSTSGDCCSPTDGFADCPGGNCCLANGSNCANNGGACCEGNCRQNRRGTTCCPAGETCPNPDFCYC